MPKSSVNASLSSYDDIFSTEESRQEEQREQVQQIPIGELFPLQTCPSCRKSGSIWCLRPPKSNLVSCKS